MSGWALTLLASLASFPYDSPVIRHREVSRLEAFSDAVFGFALTVLVVSLETPNSVDELKPDMLGFVPFALMFAMVLDLVRAQPVLPALWHAGRVHRVPELGPAVRRAVLTIPPDRWWVSSISRTRARIACGAKPRTSSA